MNLIWFRNDLRVADNLALQQACNGGKVLAIYCFDPRQFSDLRFGFKKTSQYRAQFLIETVTELRQSLSKLNISLLIYHDKPENIIPKLISQYNINKVYLQKEWTSEEKTVADSVISASSKDVTFKSSYNQFLIHPEDIPYNDFKQIPEVFTNFRKACEEHLKIRPLIPIPEPLPKDNLVKNDTNVVELTDFGLDNFQLDYRSAFPWKGGELQALARVDEYLWKTKKISVYKKTRNGLIGKDYSSKFSAWLANGSISPRIIYWHIKQFEKEIVKNESTYWLFFELLWRDFFKYVSLKHKNKIFQLKGISNESYQWENSKETLKMWIEGRTTSSFINANLKELALTGWMSNRGRQNVASFWSKELKQDWRIGASYFESMLIDYDVHSNWCNWMYTSGVGNDPRNRKFNPSRQATVYDPQGKFQNLWLQPTLF